VFSKNSRVGPDAWLVAPDSYFEANTDKLCIIFFPFSYKQSGLPKYPFIFQFEAVANRSLELERDIVRPINTPRNCLYEIYFINKKLQTWRQCETLRLYPTNVTCKILEVLS
jgi:hypothetical protein